MKTTLPWVLLILVTVALAFTAGARNLPTTPEYEVKTVFVFGALDASAMQKVNAEMAGGWSLVAANATSGGHNVILQRPKR